MAYQVQKNTAEIKKKWQQHSYLHRKCISMTDGTEMPSFHCCLLVYHCCSLCNFKRSLLPEQRDTFTFSSLTLVKIIGTVPILSFLLLENAWLKMWLETHATFILLQGSVSFSVSLEYKALRGVWVWMDHFYIWANTYVRKYPVTMQCSSCHFIQCSCWGMFKCWQSIIEQVCFICKTTMQDFYICNLLTFKSVKERVW